MYIVLESLHVAASVAFMWSLTQLQVDVGVSLCRCGSPSVVGDYQFLYLQQISGIYWFLGVLHMLFISLCFSPL